MTNAGVERDFSMLVRLMQLKANATIDTIEGIIMSRRNTMSDERIQGKMEEKTPLHQCRTI